MITCPFLASRPARERQRELSVAAARERECLPSPPAGQPGNQPHQFTGLLSFRRIVDITFETCVAALESWQLTGQDSQMRIGQSLLRGPIEHDRGSGTYRIEVQLARGPLRPLLRRRLNIDRWSSAPSRTALELIPCGRVRPTATYFRAGHLLLDSLTHSLPRHVPAQRLDCVPATKPPTAVRATRYQFRSQSADETYAPGGGATGQGVGLVRET